MNADIRGNRKPPTVWMTGTPQKKLDYCVRQVILLGKWFDETKDLFFLRAVIPWQSRMDSIEKGKL